MSKRTNYVQCTLTRTMTGTVERMVSYIPKSFAEVGKVLKLRDDSNQWIDGWVVRFVGNEVVEHDKLPNVRKAVRQHRKSTGDYLPKRSR